jgi:multidrug efflux pump subunit AcrB
MRPIHRTDQLYIGLIGAIVCMGIATANSVLLVSFAREDSRKGSMPRRRHSRRASRAAGPW